MLDTCLGWAFMRALTLQSWRGQRDTACDGLWLVHENPDSQAEGWRAHAGSPAASPGKGGPAPCGRGSATDRRRGRSAQETTGRLGTSQQCARRLPSAQGIAGAQELRPRCDSGANRWAPPSKSAHRCGPVSGAP